jgi:hypothetical protein
MGFKWTCPKCWKRVKFPTLMAAAMAARAGGCQMCRLAEHSPRWSPSTLEAVLDFFNRKGYPDET